MILSEERQSHWAHLLTDSIWNDDMVDYTDEDQALRLAKLAIKEFVNDHGLAVGIGGARHDAVDHAVG